MTSLLKEMSYCSQYQLSLDGFRNPNGRALSAVDESSGLLLALDGKSVIESSRRVFAQCERVNLCVSLSLRSLLQDSTPDETCAERIALSVRVFLITRNLQSEVLHPLNENRTCRTIQNGRIELHFERAFPALHERVSVRLAAAENVPGVSLSLHSFRLELHRTVWHFVPNVDARPLSLSLLPPTSTTGAARTEFIGHPLDVSQSNASGPCKPADALRTGHSYRISTDMTGLEPKTADLVRSMFAELQAKLQEQTIRGEPVIDLLRFLRYESGMLRPVAVVGGAVRDLLRGKNRNQVNDIDIVAAYDYKLLLEQIRLFFSVRDKPLDARSFLCDGAYKRTGMVKILRLPGTDSEDLDIGIFKAQSLVVGAATTKMQHGETVESAVLAALDNDLSGAEPSYLFGLSWTTDALFRDFTTNAVYVDVCDGALFDPCDFLLTDLKHKGRPSHTLVSAPLRLSRLAPAIGCAIDELMMADVGSHFRLFKELMKSQDDLGTAVLVGDTDTTARLCDCATRIAEDVRRALANDDGKLKIALFWLRKFTRKLFGSTALDPAALKTRATFLHSIVVRCGGTATWGAIVSLCRLLVERCQLYHVESMEDIRMFAVASAVCVVVDDVVDRTKRHDDFRAMIDSDKSIASSIADWHLPTWQNDEIIVALVAGSLEKRERSNGAIVCKLLLFAAYIATNETSISKLWHPIVRICGQDGYDTSELARTGALDGFWTRGSACMWKLLFPVLVGAGYAHVDVFGALRSTFYSWHRLPDVVVKTAEFGDQIGQLATVARNSAPTDQHGLYFDIIGAMICDFERVQDAPFRRLVVHFLPVAENRDLHYQVRDGALSCLRDMFRFRRRLLVGFDNRWLDRILQVACLSQSEQVLQSHAMDALRYLLDAMVNLGDKKVARSWVSTQLKLIENGNIDVRRSLESFLRL